MSKEELIEKAKAGRVEFNGNVDVSAVWNGDDWTPYYAQYADKNGIHACPDGLEYCVDDFEPYDFDEVYGGTTYDRLINDIIE
jgi:hypothetical protein